MNRRTDSGFRISAWAILVVLLLGVVPLAWSLRHRHLVSEAERWPTVEATVISSSFKSATNLIATEVGNEIVKSDKVSFSFRYSVDGQEYVSTSYYVFGSPPAHILAKEYPAGRRFQARYRPDAPEIAVVAPGPKYSRVLFGAMLLIALAIAGIGYNSFQR